MLTCAIYFVLTFVIPFKLTYTAFKDGSKQEKLSLWSHYWAFFALIRLLQCLFSFLAYQPFQFAILLFHLWLYLRRLQGCSFYLQYCQTQNNLFQFRSAYRKNSLGCQYCQCF